MLSPAKVTDRQKYGKQILAVNEIIDIEGYNYDYSDKASIVIGEDENENVITIYYTKITGLNFKINYLEV